MQASHLSRAVARSIVYRKWWGTRACIFLNHRGRSRARAICHYTANSLRGRIKFIITRLSSAARDERLNFRGWVYIAVVEVFNAGTIDGFVHREREREFSWFREIKFTVFNKDSLARLRRVHAQCTADTYIRTLYRKAPPMWCTRSTRWLHSSQPAISLNISSRIIYIWRTKRVSRDIIIVCQARIIESRVYPETTSVSIIIHHALGDDFPMSKCGSG